VVKEVEILKDHPHLLTQPTEIGLAGEIDPFLAEMNFAGVRAHQAVDALQQG